MATAVVMMQTRVIPGRSLASEACWHLPIIPVAAAHGAGRPWGRSPPAASEAALKAGPAPHSPAGPQSQTARVRPGSVQGSPEGCFLALEVMGLRTRRLRFAESRKRHRESTGLRARNPGFGLAFAWRVT